MSSNSGYLKVHRREDENNKKVMETLGCTELWIFRSLDLNRNCEATKEEESVFNVRMRETFKNKNIQISGCEVQITS